MSFKDELKSCRILTLGMIVCTISFVVLFLASLAKGNPMWYIPIFVLTFWILSLLKKIVVSEKGIIWRGKLISWEELKFAGEENDKLVFKHGCMEFRIPKEVIRRINHVERRKPCS